MLARSVAFAALIALALLPACGGDDEQEIRSAIRDLQQAFARQDGPAICGALTEAGREHIGTLGHDPREPCGENIWMLLDPDAKADARETGRERGPRRIEVDGDRATVVVRLGPGSVGRVPLAKEDGEWKVDALYGDIPAGEQEDNFH